MIEKELKNSRGFKDLCKVFAKLSDKKEIENLLRDLCTYDEIVSMAERLEAAKLLNKGLSYRKISEQTKASTTTITRVAQWVHHGCGGYQKALELL
jgi:TrpR-related protein YerC/YecD